MKSISVKSFFIFTKIILIIITITTSISQGAQTLFSLAAPVPPSCHASVPDSQPVLPGLHVSECTALNNPGLYPPTSGTHYLVWADYHFYDQPISDGYWLHSTEHGAVVILYNCPKGCAEVVAVLKTLINSLPTDPRCTSVSNGKITHQIILAPNLHLDSTFAVIAWGWLLKSNCLDTAAIHAFYTAHTARAPENLCNAGIDFSQTHWCDELQVAGIISPNLKAVKGSKSAKISTNQRDITFEILNGERNGFYNTTGKWFRE